MQEESGGPLELRRGDESSGRSGQLGLRGQSTRKRAEQKENLETSESPLDDDDVYDGNNE